jgi:hypothetical protein
MQLVETVKRWEKRQKHAKMNFMAAEDGRKAKNERAAVFAGLPGRRC